MISGVVVVPGRAYPAVAPLLMYASVAARRRGLPVHPVLWDAPPELAPGTLSGPRRAAWVLDRVGPVLDRAGAAPLLIGKSLGAYAATLAADRERPGIWITPLLDDPDLVSTLRTARAPYLLVGGTADESWNGVLARELTPHVSEVDGGDHGLLVEGPLAASAAALGQVVTAVERFFDQFM